MPADLRTTLFGKLAIKAGFITDEQFKEALRFQADYEAKKGQAVRIADVLKAKGFLRDGQIQAIMRRLKEMSAQPAKAKAKQQKKAPRFGEIAVGFGMLTADQVKEALILQRQIGTQKKGEPPPKIGEILVKKGYMMSHQVRAVLMEQNKKIANCPICGAGINVAQYKPSAKVQCGQCHAMLVLDPKGKSLVLDPSSTLNADPSKTRINQRVANFIIEARIGMDSTGKTYKGIDIGGRGSAVIKVYSKTALSNQAEADELSKRIRDSAKLKHDNLRKLQSMGSINGRLYVVMEYLEGHSLHRILDEVQKLPYSKVLAFAYQIGLALKDVHAAGMFHGDIRPSNILFTNDGNVKLGGLGLNLRTTDNLFNIVESGGRAPFYIAPEQVVDESRLDARSDIYSLGACMYHALTGRPPFEGASPFEVLVRFTEDPLTSIREVNPNVPATIATVVEQMITPEPDERYQTIDDLLAAFKKPKKAKPGKPPTKGIKRTETGQIVPDDVRGRITSDIIEGPEPMSLLASSAEMTPANISKALNKANVIEDELPLYYRKKLERESAPKKFPWGLTTLIGVIVLSGAVLAWSFTSTERPPASPNEIATAIGLAVSQHPGDKADNIRRRISALQALEAEYASDPEAAPRVRMRLADEQAALLRIENSGTDAIRRVRDEVGRRVTLDGVVTTRMGRRNFGEALAILDRALDSQSEINRLYEGTDALTQSDLPQLRTTVIDRARDYVEAVLAEEIERVDRMVQRADDGNRLTPTAKDELDREFSNWERAADPWRSLRDGLQHEELNPLVERVGTVHRGAMDKVAAARDRISRLVTNQQELALQASLDAGRDKVDTHLQGQKAVIAEAEQAVANLDYAGAIRLLERVERDLGQPFEVLVRQSLPRIETDLTLPDDVRQRWTGHRQRVEAELERERRQIRDRTAKLVSDTRLEGSIKEVAVVFNRNFRLRSELTRNRYELTDGTIVTFSQFTNDGVIVTRESGGTVEVKWDCRNSMYFEPNTLGTLLVDMFDLRRNQGQITEADGREALGAAMFLQRQGASRAAAQLIRRAREWGADVTEHASTIEAAYEAEASRALENFLAQIERAAANPLQSERKWWQRIQGDGAAVLARYKGTAAAQAAEPAFQAAYLRSFFLGSGLPLVAEKTREITFANGFPPAAGLNLAGGQVRGGILEMGDGAKLRGLDGRVSVLRLRFRVEPDSRGRAAFTIELPNQCRLEIELRPGRSDCTLHHPSAIRRITDAFDLSQPGWHDLRIHIPADKRLNVSTDYNPPGTSDFAFESLAPFSIDIRNGRLFVEAIQLVND